jgi:hypothetical protein
MRVFPALIVVVSALMAASAADAQWRSERPYRGLFAGGVGETTQSLVATGSLGIGWDTNLVADALGRGNGRISDLGSRFRGGVTTGSAALSYSLSRGPLGLGAVAGTTGRYYPSLGGRIIRREYASVAASTGLGYGFSAQARASYQPYTLRSWTPSLFESQFIDPVVVDEDFPTSLEHYFGYGGGLGYSRPLTPRGTFSGAYSYRGRERVGVVTDRFASHGASATYSYTMTRNLSMRLGYGYARALYGPNEYEGHLVDAGVNYSRALSFSRRTSVSFGTGSTATRRMRSDRLQFHATGMARLNHELGRTWNASLSYNRGLAFVDNWPEPVFSDSAVAGVGGLLNRRVQASAAVRALRGRGHFNLDGNRIEVYGGTAGLAVALTRHLSSGLSYSYYRQVLGDRVMVAPGLPNDLERQSIRAFLNVWVPLYQR